MKYDFLFDDGSLFSIPQGWRDVYAQYFGAMDPAAFEGGLRFLVSKYVAHRAVPSKLDGIGVDDSDGDAKYDDPRYYAERWDDGDGWEHRTKPPSMAAIAEGVLYFSMRVGLLQKMANEYAAEHGTTPIRVITPEELLEELARDEGGSASD